MLHVRRETAGHEHSDVEFFGGRMLLSLVETGLQILQALRALRNHLIVHGVLLCLGGASASRSDRCRISQRWSSRPRLRVLSFSPLLLTISLRTIMKTSSPRAAPHFAVRPVRV